MRRTTVNFFDQGKEGSYGSCFRLRESYHPGYVDAQSWSRSKRVEFINNYAPLAKQLGKIRRTSAGADDAVGAAFSLVVTAASAGTDDGKPRLDSAYCAMSVNHLAWLACADQDRGRAAASLDHMASVLCEKTAKEAESGLCPAMYQWPVSRKCRNMVQGKEPCTGLGYMELQGLITAYACSMAENACLPEERKKEAFGTQHHIKRQQKARETLLAMLMGITPQWRVLAGRMLDDSRMADTVFLRSTVMPVATGLSRTLLMAAMPADAALLLGTTVLEKAWPVTVGREKQTEVNRLVAQFFGGMASTMSKNDTTEALDKTCYVWERYLW